MNVVVWSGDDEIDETCDGLECDNQHGEKPDEHWANMDKSSRASPIEKLAERSVGLGVVQDSNSDDTKARIRQLNTRLRRTGEGGMFVMTAGVMALPARVKVKCLEILQQDYSDGEHNPDNDPFGEYDFGSIDYEGHLLFWKIDYYDLDIMHHSPDPSDETVTKRVLTVMLASEY